MNSVPWWAPFTDTGNLAILLVIGGGLLTGLLGMVIHAWKSNRESERLAVLKQQMIERGMSAEEIVRVIQAGGPGDEAAQMARAARGA